MAAKRKPFELEYKQVEAKDAQERLNRAFAILLAAGRRHRQQPQAGGDGAMAAVSGGEAGQQGGQHGEGVASS